MCRGDYHEKRINVGSVACWWKWQVIRQRLSYIRLRGVEEGVMPTCHTLTQDPSFCKQDYISHSYAKFLPPLPLWQKSGIWNPPWQRIRMQHHFTQKSTPWLLSSPQSRDDSLIRFESLCQMSPRWNEA